ncbi:LCP family protein [Nocardioides panacisoli]|uniref:LCP family protein n=1 Tax=Nocardioides panacisoli TaxID=627624 RepID=UPI001C63949A|nr:LCP family protein [Nocardioides panacisoli]QYJ04386.1 LCP family protein [Nocardioides panacisoli]
MADRPRAGSGDDPDYDWIYGQDQGRSSGADPEPTRMMPVTPRSPAPQDRRQQPPASPPPATPRRSRRMRPRSWRRVVLALLALWLIFLVAVPIFAWSRVEKIDFEPDGERPGEQPGTNYLMVGSDSRAGLSKEERRELSTGNAQSSLADTIMVLHAGSGPDVLVSFPRDWTVDGRKINGYYDPGDPTELVAALESQTGIRIDEYVEIGLGGVAGVVDAVGGIEICPEEAIKDPKAGLNVKKGCQEADGTTALGYSRTRATTRGDLDRVGRQREVVGAIGESVLSPWTVLNPFRWWGLNNAVPDFFGFGEGTSQFDVGRWALSMTRIGDGRTCTMPVTDGSATVMDTERAEGLFSAIIEDRTDDITRAQCTPAGVAP